MNNIIIDIKSPILFYIGSIPITNSITSGFLLTFLTIVLCIFIIIFTNKEGVPNKFQIFLETIVTVFENFINSITNNRLITNKILPIIGTLFIYIGVSNILLTLPLDWILIKDVSGNTVQFFRTHTGDISVTFGIAVAIVLWTQIFSIKKNNIFGHINKYIRIKTVINGFKKSRGDGFLSLIDLFLLGPLELISELAKSLSLSLRLFGNMLAGIALTVLMSAFIPIIGPAFLGLYGLFSGIIQAIVFGALSASYFASAEGD